MKTSEIIRASIDPAWGPGAAGALHRLAARVERREMLRALSGDDYLSQVEDEAREIASGKSNALPAHYHLEALLHELDQARRALSRSNSNDIPF